MSVKITINKDWCKKCGICISFCPKNVFDGEAGFHPEVARPEDCINCKLCELRCPDFAIEVRGDDNE